jgi:serine/threonine protein kinase
MATVYLAEDLKHDRKVAIKVLRPELAAVIGAERFLKEIKTTAGIQRWWRLADRYRIERELGQGGVVGWRYGLCPESRRERCAIPALHSRLRGADESRRGQGESMSGSPMRPAAASALWAKP